LAEAYGGGAEGTEGCGGAQRGTKACGAGVQRGAERR
jgi:hypothetical protein